MARDPGSLWAPLPEAGAPDGFTKTQFIVHSTGDNASADRIRRYFAQLGVVVESTFIVGLDESDPTLQVMDSTDNADANVASNQRAISVEVVGDGTGPFTEHQVREIIRLGRWALDEPAHKIEPRICPAYDQPGFGWHVMFGAPGPWTTVNGKVCPGAVRIEQLKSRIFPAIFDDTSEEDFFMALTDREQREVRDKVRELHRLVPELEWRVWAKRKLKRGASAGTGTAEKVLTDVETVVRRLEETVNKLVAAQTPADPKE